MKRTRKNEDNNIISIEKHDHNYSLIDNTGIRDANLSYKATGIWVFLVSHPKDWKVNLSHLSNSKADGRDSVLSGLSELYEAGYLLYLRWRDAEGLWSSRYIVFETPQLKEKYLERMPEEDKNKLTVPFNPTKAKSRKIREESTTENPLWNQNGKSVTEKPQRKIRNGKSEQTNNIYTNDLETNDLEQIKSPLTPQGETVGEIFQSDSVFQKQKSEPEGTVNSPSRPTAIKQAPCTAQNINPEIKHPPAIENDYHFVPSDPTAENMATWNAIAATGAMKGATSVDPSFLEYYRLFLSKCSAYKGKECNSNHAKASLKKQWREEPLRILAEAENWQKSQAIAVKQPSTRNIDEIPKDELYAILKAVEDKNQQKRS